MSDNTVIDDSSTDLEEIRQIGPVRSEKLREQGFETVREVAEATVDELATICTYAGATRAAVMKDSATGYAKHRKDAQSETEADSGGSGGGVVGAHDFSDAPARSTDSDARSILILGPQDEWYDRPEAEVEQLIEQAMERYGLVPEEGDSIGMPEPVGKGDMGAEIVQSWAIDKIGLGNEWGLRTFSVKDTDEYQRERPPGVDPTWAIAYEERDSDMMEWATHVLVVEEGEWTFSTLNQAPELSPPIVKTFLSREQDYAWMEDDERVELREITEDTPEEDWYDSKSAPDDDPERGFGHVWIADRDDDRDDDMPGGGPPGGPTLT